LLRALKRLAKSAGLNCNRCEGCKVNIVEKTYKSKDGSTRTTKVKIGEECEQWKLHSLRRTAITGWLRAGIDLATVSAWAGHESIETTQVYLRPAESDEMQDAVNAMWPAIAKKPGKALAARPR
jgi:integrase